MRSHGLIESPEYSNEPTVARPPPNIVRRLAKPFQYAATDSEAFAAFARKAVETICKEIFLREVGDPKQKMLEELIGTLRHNKRIPAKIVLPITTVQRYGNYSVHDQDDEGEAIEDVEPCAAALKQIIRWFYVEYLHTGVPRELSAAVSSPGSRSGALRIACLRDLHEREIDVARLLEDWLRLDYDVLDSLAEEDEGRVDQWLPVVLSHPDTWRLLLDGADRIVGYWHFVPLFDQYYESAREGMMRDGRITPDMIPHMGLPGVHRAYFMAIAVHPAHRSSRTFQLLFGAFVEQLASLAEQGVFFSEICANAWSHEGLSLCRTLGMRPLGPHCEHGTMHVLALEPYPKTPLFLGFCRLADLYQPQGP